MNPPYLPIMAFFLIAINACCSHPGIAALPTDCSEPGTIGRDRVTDLTQGFDISFQYYLPPCYDETDRIRYPVIYLISMPYEARLDEAANTPMSLADRLIRDRRLGPVILIVPDDTVGYGYHAALALDLVPYVDSQFHTLPERRFRGTGGISHGAAIAARMAFQYPDHFGSLGVFSGGIPAAEGERFTGWIASNPVETRPRVLVDIGAQDPIFPLTQNLIKVFDAHDVPFTLNRGEGGHSWKYWSGRMELYLLWFAEGWK
jgi:enterochelin esterase family protein